MVETCELLPVGTHDLSSGVTQSIGHVQRHYYGVLLLGSSQRTVRSLPEFWSSEREGGYSE